MTKISLTVDGEKVSDDVEPRMLLVQYLREKLGKTGTVIGCDTSNCGACTVHLDGRSVKSLQRAGGPGRRRTRSTTIEGLADDDGDAAPGAGGVPRVPRPPVRLLHAGDDHAVASTCSTRTRTRPRRRSGVGPRGQPVPLHRLPQHRQVRSCTPPSSSRAPRPRRGRPHDRRRRPPGRSPEIGKDRRRKEDQRLITGRTRWTDNITLPGHAAPGDGAQPVRAREDHRASTPRPPTSRDQRRRRSSPARTSARTQGVMHQRLADHARPGHARPTRRCRPTGSPSPARSSPSSSPAAPPRPATPPSSSTSSTTSCPAALDLKEAAEDKVLAHPDLGTNKSALLGASTPRGRHRRQRRRGHREGARRRHRDRARVPPAAADPGVHGAALGRRRPDRRADHHVVGDPDPAHPAVRRSRPRPAYPSRRSG